MINFINKKKMFIFGIAHILLIPNIQRTNIGSIKIEKQNNYKIEVAS
jgi:hypothetical protein